MKYSKSHGLGTDRHIAYGILVVSCISCPVFQIVFQASIVRARKQATCLVGTFGGAHSLLPFLTPTAMAQCIVTGRSRRSLSIPSHGGYSLLAYIMCTLGCSPGLLSLPSPLLELKSSSSYQGASSSFMIVFSCILELCRHTQRS
jgi:hypothetical protein